MTPQELADRFIERAEVMPEMSKLDILIGAEAALQDNIDLFEDAHRLVKEAIDAAREEAP